MSVTAYVRLAALPGRRSELLDVMADAIAATRAQPACQRLEVMLGIDREDDVLLVEEWATVEDHIRFITGVIEAGGLQTIQELLAEEIETFHYTTTAA